MTKEVRRKSRAIIKLFSMQISEQILLLNHSYPSAHQRHYYPLTLAFFCDLLSHCSSVPRSSLCFHPIFHFQSTNQSAAQFTSDSNLTSIAILIPAASCSGGQMQRKKMGETKPTRHRCAVSQP